MTAVDTNDGSQFYEDDEPIEKVQRAFDRGVKGVTGRPPHDPEGRASKAGRPLSISWHGSAVTVRGVRLVGSGKRTPHFPASRSDKVERVSVRY